MRTKWLQSLAGLFLLTLVVSACSFPLAQSSPSTAEYVTFVVPIQVEDFSQDATLRVSLWTAEQMEAAEETGDCIASYDTRTGVEEIQCPDGVDYVEVTPEEFTIPMSDVGDSISVTSKSIRVGERYRVQVSGLSDDDCNQASASTQGTARSATLTLDNLEWVSTLMACP
jgi:hypothetical protein